MAPIDTALIVRETRPVRLLRRIILIFALAAVPAGASAVLMLIRGDWNVFVDQQISLVEATQWKDRVLWVDARSETDFNKGHIPGALLLNEDDWSGLLPGLVQTWTPDRVIIVYCSSRSCQASEGVAKRLRDEAGFSSVYVLRGGWETWTSAHPLPRS